MILTCRDCDTPLLIRFPGTLPSGSQPGSRPGEFSGELSLSCTCGASYRIRIEQVAHAPDATRARIAKERRARRELNGKSVSASNTRGANIQ